MSKVTIKFWNTEKNKYEDNQHWLAVESSGDIIFIQDADYSNDLIVSSIDKGLEAHFYKDGERIA